jgi:hypothetical protein
MQATRLLYIAAILLFSVSGCSKKGGRDCGSESRRPQATAPLATGSFRINNLADDGSILEGRTLSLTVDARNAVSYRWDFGDGIVITGINPQYAYHICSTLRTVSLTVTNCDGVSSTFASHFNIRCSAGYTGGRLGAHQH